MGKPAIQHEPGDLWFSNPPAGPGVRKRVDRCFQTFIHKLSATLHFWSPWRQRTKLELWIHGSLFSFHMKYLKRFLLPGNIRWGIGDHIGKLWYVNKTIQPSFAVSPSFPPNQTFGLLLVGSSASRWLVAGLDLKSRLSGTIASSRRSGGITLQGSCPMSRGIDACLQSILMGQPLYLIGLSHVISLQPCSFQRIDPHRIPRWRGRILFEFRVLCLEYRQLLSNRWGFSKRFKCFRFWSQDVSVQNQRQTVSDGILAIPFEISSAPVTRSGMWSSRCV